jgi:uncharacterized protein (DUF924 family)
MSSRTQKIYVSLTAIGARLGTLGKVLHSILNQSLAPDEIFLVVSEEARFLDSGVTIESIPGDIAALIEAGSVTLIFAANTGPYRKLVPVLERCRDVDCLIVTADDDTIYPGGWLLHLVEAYEKHQCVIAYRGRAMRVVGQRFDEYRRWSKVPTWRDNFGDVDPRYHGLFTLATGVFGVVYSPRFFPDPGLLDRLMEIAPLQDDLAFKAAALVNEVPTHIVIEVDGDDPAWSFQEICHGTQLFDTNIDNNDLVWKKIVDLISRDYGFDIGRYTSPPRESAALQADWVSRVLSFWFDELSAADRLGNRPGVDEKVRDRFGDLFIALRDASASMSFDDPDSALAAIIVFDQFSRRIFRRDARKFATDPLALATARHALSFGFDKQVSAARRLFFYLPFSHSEDIADQELCVALTASLGPEPWKSAAANRDIIARFGRFPHRNKALGRPNTAAETLELFPAPDGT